jgi:ABC-type glycerol-3-phosphate transport system substrate-binding protein
MVHPDQDEGESGVSRRKFLGAAGTGAAMGVAGCMGGGDGGDGNQAIQMSMDGEWADAQEPIVQALYDAGLSEDIDVEFLPGDFETGARQTDFTSALDAGRSSPDIFMMDSGWTIPFIVREQLVNLSEEMSSDTLDFVQSDYLSATVSTASHPESGDLYGLPVFPD